MKFQVKENLRLFWKLNLEQKNSLHLVVEAKTNDLANLQEHFSNNYHQTKTKYS